MLNCVESLKTNLPTTHHAKTPFTGRHPKTIGSITDELVRIPQPYS